MSTPEILHKELTGEDLHYTRIDQRSGSPIGVFTPPVSNYLVRDTITNKIYISTGTTNNDWILLKGSSNSVDVEYQNGQSVKTAIDLLNQTKGVRIEYGSINPTTGAPTGGGTPLNQVMGIIPKTTYAVEWNLVIRSITTNDLYASQIYATHASGVFSPQFDFSEQNIQNVGFISGLSIDPQLSGSNLVLKITATENVYMRVLQFSV